MRSIQYVARPNPTFTFRTYRRQILSEAHETLYFPNLTSCAWDESWMIYTSIWCDILFPYAYPNHLMPPSLIINTHRLNVTPSTCSTSAKPALIYEERWTVNALTHERNRYDRSTRQLPGSLSLDTSRHSVSLHVIDIDTKREERKWKKYDVLYAAQHKSFEPTLSLSVHIKLSLSRQPCADWFKSITLHRTNSQIIVIITSPSTRSLSPCIINIFFFADLTGFSIPMIPPSHWIK